MILVRIVAPHFVAGLETDGIVRRTAPILKKLLGKTDDEVRAYVERMGYRASIVRETKSGSQNLGKAWTQEC